MSYDLAVIGAGPAGLAAALAAADAGLRVALVDAAGQVGGQYYRHLPPSFNATRPGALHHGWDHFTALRDGVAEHPLIDHRAGHRVWTITPGFTVHAGVGEREQHPAEVRARRLVIAAGAYDRSLPFPGWDLPGVLTAGGAPALLKGDLVVAGKRIVVAGSGPFLLPVAAGLAAAGAEVAGVYEANRPDRRLIPAALHPAKLLEGAGYAAALLRHRISYRTGHAVIAAHGELAVEAVNVARLDRGWNPVPGTERTVACDVLAAGYGFTPQVELPLQLGCATRVDADGSLVVEVDAAQRTSVPGVYAAGETTGVGGAPLALIEGELAGIAAAQGFIAQPAMNDVGRRVRSLVRRRARLRGFAAVLQAGYPVREGWMGWLRDDTLVCRCEEVPRARLAEAVDLGGTDARAAKLISRAGMGWCQGRVCGYATARLTAEAAGREHRAEDLCGLAQRPLAQPVRLGDLAAAPPPEEIGK